MMLMNTRSLSAALEAELNYRAELYLENCEEEDTLCLVGDALIDCLFEDIENAGFKEFTREIIDWQIAKGIVRYITDEEYASHTVTPASSKNRAYPKHRGQRTEFVRHLYR
jgi:hypothetical protein